MMFVASFVRMFLLLHLNLVLAFIGFISWWWWMMLQKNTTMSVLVVHGSVAMKRVGSEISDSQRGHITKRFLSPQSPTHLTLTLSRAKWDHHGTADVCRKDIERFVSILGMRVSCLHRKEDEEQWVETKTLDVAWWGHRRELKRRKLPNFHACNWNDLSCTNQIKVCCNCKPCIVPVQQLWQLCLQGR